MKITEITNKAPGNKIELIILLEKSINGGLLAKVC